MRTCKGPENNLQEPFLPPGFLFVLAPGELASELLGSFLVSVPLLAIGAVRLHVPQQLSLLRGSRSWIKIRSSGLSVSHPRAPSFTH